MTIISRSIKAVYPGKMEEMAINHHPGLEIHTYDIDVITPLFGGGVDTQTIDPDHPIRESSIRGHLRFWWRATRGAQYAEVSELSQRESEIWGSTENPSPVSITVVVTGNGTTYPCMSIPPNGRRPQFNPNHPPYALFPFQGDRRKGIPIASCVSGLSFSLNLAYPKSYEDDVLTAVRAWINFGGIGARTRRGCGALFCKDLAPTDESTISQLLLAIQNNSGARAATPQSWPTLKQKLLIKKTNNDILQCWSEVIGLMKKFRQDPPVGRSNKGRTGPVGRSYWPEPETIRRLTKQRLPEHTRTGNMPNDAFPRAEFGLPMVFHFKDNPDNNSRDPNLDPADTELYPVIDNSEKTRMGSPLILKPLKCANGNILGIILWLRTPPVPEVVLKKAAHNPHCRKIRGPDLASYPNSPMGIPPGKAARRSDKGSALEAFISFAKNENGFLEVS